MKRKKYSFLQHWKSNNHRKPLLMLGARQVGKTFLLKQFGETEFKSTIYLNFELEKQLQDLFSDSLAPEKIISNIELFFNKKIIAQETLIVFDEIQACEKALSSLKYFRENNPEYYIAAAGSLLGVTVNRKEFSFPVGQVDITTLHSLDFEEFLWALNEERLAEEIKVCCFSNQSFALHKKAIQIYHDFLVVGGMPEVVFQFAANKDFGETARIQQQIIDSYIADMSKYANDSSEIGRLIATYNSIPAQLAKDNKKFQYKVVQRGGHAAMFGTSIDWLEAAGLVIKCNRLSAAQLPLAAYKDLTGFKLYMNDVGLLTRKAEMPLRSIFFGENIQHPFIGAIAENYVASQLSAAGFNLYYWESGNTAEIDFLIQIGDNVVPIEVKSGINTRSKSLDVYRKKFAPALSIRLSEKNFGFENGIKSVPLYAVFCISNEY